MRYAASNQNGGSWNYNFPLSSSETIYSKAHFFQRVQDGVDNHKPMLIPSYYDISYGHFYAVVGYEVKYYSNGSINYNNSKVYLRDVSDSSPGVWYETEAKVSTFYNARNGNKVLFVRP